MFYVVVYWLPPLRSAAVRFFDLRSEADEYADQVYGEYAHRNHVKVGMVAPAQSSSMRVALWLRECGMTLQEVCDTVNGAFMTNLTRVQVRQREQQEAFRKRQKTQP